MAVADKLNTVYTGCTDIRAAIKESDSTLGSGNISTLGNNLRTIFNRNYIYKVIKTPIQETVIDETTGESSTVTTGYNYTTEKEVATSNKLRDFRNTTNLVALLVPNNITSRTQTFAGCTSLEYINWYNFKATIPSEFNGCTSLKYIGGFNDITVVAPNAFFNCKSLNIDVNLPNLTSLGVASFRNSGITKVSNLGNVTAIPGGYTFSGCSNLVDFNFVGITSVGDSAFNSSTKLSANISTANSFVTIGNNAFLSTKITGDLNAPNLTSLSSQSFYHCNLLNILNLGTITSIPSYAFADNPNLKVVYLPETLTAIYSRVFASDKLLEKVIVLAQTPPTISGTPFEGTNSTFKIYVPYSSDHSVLDAYKSATGWTSYAARILELNEDGSVPA